MRAHKNNLKNMCTAHILRPREYMLSLKILGRENTTPSIRLQKKVFAKPEANKSKCRKTYNAKFHNTGILRCWLIEKSSVKTMIFSKSLSFTRIITPLQIPIYWNFALPADRKSSVKTMIFGKSPSFTHKIAPLQILIYWNFALPCMGSVRRTGQIVKARCPQNRTDGKSTVSTKVDRQ